MIKSENNAADYTGTKSRQHKLSDISPLKDESEYVDGKGNQMAWGFLLSNTLISLMT